MRGTESERERGRVCVWERERERESERQSEREQGRKTADESRGRVREPKMEKYG